MKAEKNPEVVPEIVREPMSTAYIRPLFIHLQQVVVEERIIEFSRCISLVIKARMLAI